jgi:DNA polymerase (family 10)
MEKSLLKNVTIAVMKMKLEEAKAIAEEFVERIRQYTEKIEIAGSIRRKRPEVNDIDIVTIANPKILIPEIKKIARVTREGEKIVFCEYKGKKIDVYITDEKSYETVKLIRTGSAKHNIKLARIALSKGWRLKSGGEGLVDENGNVIANTEEGILIKLLGKYVPPEMREI